MEVSTAGLLRTHRAVWSLAVKNPFLEALSDGTLPQATFARYLAQGRYLADAIFITTARVLSKAPPEDRGVLLARLASCENDLRWSGGVLSRRPHWLEPIHPVCRAFTDFLLNASCGSYAGGLAAIWTLQRAIVDDWSGVTNPPAAYRQIVERLSSPEAKRQARHMGGALDRALGETCDRERAVAADNFGVTVRYVIDFWVMTFERDVA